MATPPINQNPTQHSTPPYSWSSYIPGAAVLTAYVAPGIIRQLQNTSSWVSALAPVASAVAGFTLGTVWQKSSTVANHPTSEKKKACSANISGWGMF